MDRKGGRAAWICCNGFYLVVLVKLNTKLVIMVLFSVVSLMIFLIWILGTRRQGSLKREGEDSF